MKNKNRIITERTLEIGNALLQEGSSAYIHFYQGKNCVFQTPIGPASDCWMYGTIFQMTNTEIWFYTGTDKPLRKIFLYPEQILEVTEKCPFEDPTLLLNGEFIPGQTERRKINGNKK